MYSSFTDKSRLVPPWVNTSLVWTVLIKGVYEDFPISSWKVIWQLDFYVTLAAGLTDNFIAQFLIVILSDFFRFGSRLRSLKVIAALGWSVTIHLNLSSVEAKFWKLQTGKWRLRFCLRAVLTTVSVLVGTFSLFYSVTLTSPSPVWV